MITAIKVTLPWENLSNGGGYGDYHWYENDHHIVFEPMIID